MQSLKPLRVPAFRRLAVSYSLNEVGWGFGTVALALLVYERTGSALAPTALFLATSFLPAFLAPALTARIDGLAVRRVLPALYLVEALIFCGLAALTGSFSLPAVLVLALADGALALTGRALTRASVAAALTPRGALREGNALLNVLFAIAFAVGPAAGGLVVSVAGIGVSLLVSAGIFAVMACTLASSRDLPSARADVPEPWRERVAEGLRFVRDEPQVRRLLALRGTSLTVATLVIPIEVVFARSTLHGGQAAYGVLLAVWGAGTVVGSVFYARAGRIGVATLLPCALLAMGLGYGTMAVAPTLAVALVGCLLGGAGNGVEQVSVIQALQEPLPAEFQARVMGLLESVQAASIGIGFMAGGLIAYVAGTRPVFATAACGLAVATVAARVLLTGRRAVPEPRAEPAPAQA
jgi:MFS family permease